jgi:hypothetical protein
LQTEALGQCDPGRADAGWRWRREYAPLRVLWARAVPVEAQADRPEFQHRSLQKGAEELGVQQREGDSGSVTWRSEDYTATPPPIPERDVASPEH